MSRVYQPLLGRTLVDAEGAATLRFEGRFKGGRHGKHATCGDRSESLGAVHVRVWAKDEDCDEKRSPTRSCNGSAFSIYSWPQSPRREGSKQIQTSSRYSGYLPGAPKRDGSRMPGIPIRFSQSKETSLVRKYEWKAGVLRCRLITRTATAWTTDARISVEPPDRWVWRT
jgi:hypothetical protein